MTVAGAAAVAGAAPSRVVRLLPGFDPYVVGALRQLDHLLPAPGLKARVSRASGWISPVLVDGGRIVGTWTRSSPTAVWWWRSPRSACSAAACRRPRRPTPPNGPPRRRPLTLAWTT